MGWARGLSAGSSLVNNALSGASQRRGRDQIMEMNQRAMDQDDFEAIRSMSEQAFYTTESTGETMPDGTPVTRRRELKPEEIMNDPQRLQTMKELANNPHFRRRYLGGHELVDVLQVPEAGEKNTSVILKHKDTGELVPMTVGGLNRGDSGYEQDTPWFESPTGIIGRMQNAMLTDQRELEGLFKAGNQERIQAAMAAFDTPNSGRQMLVGDQQAPVNQINQLGGSARSFPAADYTPQVEEIPQLGQSALKGVDINSNARRNVEEYVSKHPEVVQQAAQRAGMPVDKFVALMGVVHQIETGGSLQATSAKGADGAMQVMPETARDPGYGVKPLNPNDPDDNFRFGADYLAAMLEEHNGDVDLALAAYNAGPGNVKKHGGVPPFGETQGYVKQARERLGASFFQDSSPEPQSGLGEAELGGGDVPDQGGEQLSRREQVIRNRNEATGTPSQSPDAQQIYRGGREATVIAPNTKEMVDRRVAQAREGGGLGHTLGHIAGGAAELPGAVARDLLAKPVDAVKEAVSVGGGVVKEVAETAKTIADSDFGRGMTGRESKAVAEARDATAKETDSSIGAVTTELRKPIHETDPQVAAQTLEQTVQRMSGLPEPRDTQIMARWKQAMQRPVSENYIHYLALNQRRGNITSQQAQQMFASAQTASANAIELETNMRAGLAKATKAEYDAYKSQMEVMQTALNEPENGERPHVSWNDPAVQRGVKMSAQTYMGHKGAVSLGRALSGDFKLKPEEATRTVLLSLGAMSQKYPHLIEFFYGGIDVPQLLASGEMSPHERVHFDQLLNDNIGEWSSALGRKGRFAILGTNGIGGKPEERDKLMSIALPVDVRGEVAPGLSVQQAINDTVRLLMQAAQNAPTPEERAAIEADMNTLRTSLSMPDLTAEEVKDLLGY